MNALLNYNSYGSLPNITSPSLHNRIINIKCFNYKFCTAMDLSFKDPSTYDVLIKVYTSQKKFLKLDLKENYKNKHHNEVKRVAQANKNFYLVKQKRALSNQKETTSIQWNVTKSF